MKSLSAKERRDIIVRAATALKWLAEQGYIHGDIKFQNMYRDTAGNIYLLDFGSAQTLVSAQDSQIENEISKFTERITPISDSKVPNFDLKPYESDERNALIPFYDFIIHYYSDAKQSGGRRRHQTRRHVKKRRNTRRRKI
jgi:serine/threonine protein kinase